MSTETVLDCCDEVITLLKSENLQIAKRKEQIDTLLGLSPLNADEFNQIVVWTQQLIDFEPPSLVNRVDNQQQEQEIAIDLDESEEEGDQVDVVQEEADQSNTEEKEVERPDRELTFSDIGENWLKDKITATV